MCLDVTLDKLKSILLRRDETPTRSFYNTCFRNGLL